MTLKIFLDDKSFHCLKQSIPARSRSKSIIEQAVHLDLFGGNAVISSDEAEARNLLIYAGHCPGVIASIHNAFQSAGLTLGVCLRNGRRQNQFPFPNTDSMFSTAENVI
jgi:hypothetical protein